MGLSRLIPRANHLAVFFFAGVVLLSETVLFHAAKFVVGYVLAVTVIGCAVAGVGLGALLASRLRWRESELFPVCCGGTTLCLYLAAFVLLRYADLLLLLPAVAAVFVFPSTFIARALARRHAAIIYCWDMLGAAAAVGLVVYSYQHAGTEAIYLAVLTVLPAVGALWMTQQGTHARTWRAAILWGLALLAIGGGFLLYQHATTNQLNIARLVNPKGPNIPAQHLLRRPSRLRITRTYDSLIGRVDVIPARDRTVVTYDGFFNDNFRDYPVRDYRQYAQPHQIRLPTSDRRVVYGLVEEPHVFVIGTAAAGILKTLREITPVEYIDGVEINPGILQMMQHDFLEQSGRVYKDLRVNGGNALSLLRRTEKKYDIITLINAHSSRWIGALGPPDFLHTRESYDLYLDRLTDDGYLLFEERPETWMGELGVKRMILTLYDCLKRRGVENPADHFFIWEFMSNRFSGSGVETGSDMYYVGMVVSREPFRGERREKLMEWTALEWTVVWDEREQPVYFPRPAPIYPAYLRGQWHNERFGPFFDMLVTENFTALTPDFDDRVITNDRPFPSCATHSVTDLERLLIVTGGVCFILGTLIAWGVVRNVPRSRQPVTFLLILYNLAIGSAYFLIEIMLIQSYQSVYLSPSTSLVLVLAVLLVGSGIGGLFSSRIRPGWATLALGPLLLLALWIPTGVLSLAWWSSQAIASCGVLAVGFCMGVYFPNGLVMARRWSLRQHIPHLFALNSVSGSLATVVSYYLAIRVGYSWTVALALMLYLLAWMVYRHCVSRERGPTEIG